MVMIGLLLGSFDFGGCDRVSCEASHEAPVDPHVA